MASNKSLAEFNLTFEPKLKTGKAALMELYEKARGVTDELETKRAQLGECCLSIRLLVLIFIECSLSNLNERSPDFFFIFIFYPIMIESLYSRTSLDTTHALLQTAALEAEEESDKITEQFLDGLMDAETFMSQYEPARCLSHMRRLKSEKMAELVKQSQRGRTSFSTSVPYPTSPPQMPMPGMPMPM